MAGSVELKVEAEDSAGLTDTAVVTIRIGDLVFRDGLETSP